MPWVNWIMLDPNTSKKRRDLIIPVQGENCRFFLVRPHWRPSLKTNRGWPALATPWVKSGGAITFNAEETFSEVWTNDWSIWISPEIRMDQWRSKFSESFSLDRHWSIECSFLIRVGVLRGGPPFHGSRKFQDTNSECKLSNGRSRSYKVVKLLLSAGKWVVVAKLQGDKSAMGFWTPSRFLKGSYQNLTLVTLAYADT